ncbi:MAG: hypothetical protein QOH70_1460 [Blastocatellia bacterium]|jgi:hypothetical protein|nr:hypothetical protein [Blastocatellia bacterium]
MPNTLQLFGILFLVAAVVTAILNLHRVADLGPALAGAPALNCRCGLHDAFKTRERIADVS